MKKLLKQVFSSRKIIFWISGGLIPLIIISLLLFWPKDGPADLALKELSRSYRDDVICHETCLVGRQEAVEIIVNELSKNPRARLANRVKENILNEKNLENFRVKLVAITSKTGGDGGADGGGSAPDYLQAYLSNGQNVAVRAEILAAYQIKALSAEANPLDYYFKILAGEDNLVFRLAALSALSSLTDKKDYLNDGQLELIKKIIFNSGTDKRLRQPLILLLSEYFTPYPEETKSILMTYYLTDASGDNVSRAFAADSLNRWGGEELAVPEVSPQEWDEYYNH